MKIKLYFSSVQYVYVLLVLDFADVRLIVEKGRALFHVAETEHDQMRGVASHFGG